MVGFRRSSELAMNWLRFFDAIVRGEKWATMATMIWVLTVAGLAVSLYLFR